MRETKFTRRATALFLSVAMLFTMSGTPVYAVSGGKDAETTGLCEHHPAHTADCGYVEAQPGTPCSHEHTEECYRLVEKCVHEHTAECYPEEDDLEDEATPSNAKALEPAECSHECSEDTGCITQVLDCPHEHKVNGGEADRECGLGLDENCGYVPATEGTSCNFVCSACNTASNADNKVEKVKFTNVKAEYNKRISVRMSIKGGTADEKVSGGAATDLGATHTITITPNKDKYVVAGYFSDENYYMDNPDEYHYDNMQLEKITPVGTAGEVTFQFKATEYIPIDNDASYDYICLYFYCAELPEKVWPMDVYGDATAPSADGTVAAEPYISNRDLCGEPNAYTGYYQLSETEDRKYLDWEVLSIKDAKTNDSLGGEVLFENNKLKYIPTANEAGKTVQIEIRPCLGFVKEGNTPITFEIKVKKPVEPTKDFLVATFIEGGGSALPFPNPAEAGKEITLYAFPNEGYHFKGWEVVSGNISISNGSFTMPAEDVAIKAVFESDYHFGDMAVINGIIANNGLEGVLPDKPESWNFVTWDNSSSKRIAELNLSHRNLTGTLDLTRLDSLIELDCASNQLTSLDLSGLSNLTTLDCGNNPFTSFKTNKGNTLTINAKTGGKVVTTAFNLSNNEIELTATPDNSYIFKVWDTDFAEADKTDNKIRFTLDNDKIVTAYFIDSDEVALKNLSLSEGTLSPGFDPAITSYTASVDNSVDSVSINTEAAHDKSTVTGAGTKSLNVGDNIFTITVTAGDGTIVRNYNITINRAASSDASLKNLSLSEGALFPGFNPAITSYTASVGNSVDSVAITAETAHNKATVTGTGTKSLNVGENTFTITVTAENGATMSYTLTITRQEETNNGGNSGGGSSSSGGSGNSGNHTTITPPAGQTTDTPTVGEITIGKHDTDGVANILAGQIESALKQAQKDAEKNGRKENGVAVSVKLPNGTTSATLDRTALDKLTGAGAKSLTLNFDGASMTFSLDALGEITKQSAGTVTFSVKPATLTGDAKKAIGKRPAFDFTVSYQKDGQTVYITNFGKDGISLAIHYTPAAGEQAGSLFAVCGDGGKAEWITPSSYDQNNKVLRFTAHHLSIYGVGYKTPPAFTDIANHWAKADIDFVVSRGLLSGTSATTFSPNTSMTRGMFVTALGRLAGIDPAIYQTRSFTDVKADAYYSAYVEWAAKQNIVKGTGEGLFSPDTPVTREQMAVIMTNYAGQMGYSIPATLKENTFTDHSSISAWAAKEVKAMQTAGIITGKDGNRFDPQGSATRAEVSAVLRRFVELVIDPATADGWTKNDSGHWLYYKDGKALTGWKQIESKWYYFYPDGAMAVNTKIDGYEIGPDGARKE